MVQRENLRLEVYLRYKEIVKSSTTERALKKTDATDLDSVDSDAMMLRRLTIQIRRIVNEYIIKNIVENTDFSCAADATEVVEVYGERLNITTHIKSKMKNVNPNALKVLTVDEMVELLQETVRESVRQSGMARAGQITQRKAIKEIEKKGWKIIGTNEKHKGQDIDILAQDRNENTSPEIVKIGVSVKKSVRERWRQNLAENDKVDVFVHASLGNDIPSRTEIEKHPKHIHVVANDAELADKLEKSMQVQRISWLTPDNIRKYIAEL